MTKPSLIGKLQKAGEGLVASFRFAASGLKIGADTEIVIGDLYPSNFLGSGQQRNWT